MSVAKTKGSRMNQYRSRTKIGGADVGGADLGWITEDPSLPLRVHVARLCLLQARAFAEGAGR
jgi:hypothetical protein